MSDNTPEQYNPITELRKTMASVRRMHESGLPAYALALAGYEQDTQTVHEEFLDGFAAVLPAKQETFQLALSRDRKQYGERLITQKAEHVIPALTFGIAVAESNRWEPAVATFPIGEKLVTKNPHLTNVLLLYAYPDSLSCAIVLPVVVSTERWRATRDERLQNLAGPSEPTDLAHRFSPGMKGFAVNTNELITLEKNYLLNRADPENLSLLNKRRFSKNGEYHKGSISCKASDVRRIRGTDFADFNVMYHLEILATAFNIEAAFDEIKAKRAAQLPPAPEEKMFGLKNYRAVTEGEPL